MGSGQRKPGNWGRRRKFKFEMQAAKGFYSSQELDMQIYEAAIFLTAYHWLVETKPFS